MSDPYLILHKVRGEPAFDIAEMMEVDGHDDEPWWIIPTSGHRAYPWRFWMLDVVGDEHEWEAIKCAISYPNEEVDDPLWLTLPDHYSLPESRSKLASAAQDILSLIGLKPKAPTEPVKRRVIPNG